MPLYTVICNEPTYYTWSTEVEAGDQFAALEEAKRQRKAGELLPYPSCEGWEGLEDEYIVEVADGENAGAVLLTQCNPIIGIPSRGKSFAEAFRAAWPALVNPNDDSEVNGGDLVEWCANWWAECRQEAPS